MVWLYTLRGIWFLVSRKMVVNKCDFKERYWRVQKIRQSTKEIQELRFEWNDKMKTL